MNVPVFARLLPVFAAIGCTHDWQIVFPPCVSSYGPYPLAIVREGPPPELTGVTVERGRYGLDLRPNTYGRNGPSRTKLGRVTLELEGEGAIEEWLIEEVTGPEVWLYGLPERPFVWGCELPIELEFLDDRETRNEPIAFHFAISADSSEPLIIDFVDDGD